MSSQALYQPHRSSDRRIRRRKLKSVFIHAPQECPNKFLITTKEFCATWGISELTATKWRNQWIRNGYHNSPQPRNYSDNADPEYRYYFDEVCGLPEGTWLERFKAQQRSDFALPIKSKKTA